MWASVPGPRNRGSVCGDTGRRLPCDWKSLQAKEASSPQRLEETRRDGPGVLGVSTVLPVPDFRLLASQLRDKVSAVLSAPVLGTSFQQPQKVNRGHPASESTSWFKDPSATATSQHRPPFLPRARFCVPMRPQRATRKASVPLARNTNLLPTPGG